MSQENNNSQKNNQKAQQKNNAKTKRVQPPQGLGKPKTE
jgi:hypothetical protein